MTQPSKSSPWQKVASRDEILFSLKNETPGSSFNSAGQGDKPKPARLEIADRVWYEIKNIESD